MKGIKIEWTDAMLETLRTEFPTTLNRDLARKLGVGQWTMIRKARELNLVKSDTFRTDNSKEISWRIKIGQKYSFNTNWKRTQFKKGHVATGKPYQKGHSCKEELGEEKNRLRIQKAAETMRHTRRMEKFRSYTGLPRQTKLRVDKQSQRKLCQNYYLRKRGYTLDIQHGIAYWTENTHRAKMIEAKGEYFKFIQQDQQQ